MFDGGSIASVSAAHELAPTITPSSAGASVGVSSAGVHPGGLIFTVIFSAGTSRMEIDYSSGDTFVASSDVETYPVVSFHGEGDASPSVATLVQDSSNYLYLFASNSQPVQTVEVGLTSAQPGLIVSPIAPGLSVQMGDDFFGMSRLDGSGTPLVLLFTPPHSHPQSSFILV